VKRRRGEGDLEKEEVERGALCEGGRTKRLEGRTCSLREGTLSIGKEVHLLAEEEGHGSYDRYNRLGFLDRRST
jgi:hypothetical protein